MSKISQNIIHTVLWYYNQCTILLLWPAMHKNMILAKNSRYAKMREKRKFAHFRENWMNHCAVPIAPRILKLYQNLLNNMLYWNPEGFFDTSIVKKMTVSWKPLKTHQNGQFWDFEKFFGGQKKFLGQKFFFYHIPHDNRNFSIKSNFFIGNFQNLVFFGF